MIKDIGGATRVARNFKNRRFVCLFVCMFDQGIASIGLFGLESGDDYAHPIASDSLLIMFKIFTIFTQPY